jgi:glutathione peroxidase-family protein
MAKTTYNYKRYKMSEYELGVFPGAKAGEIADNFTLRDQDGSEVSLEQYRGKWVVLETGSITCSMYVKNISGIKKLEAKYPDVEFLLIYVREAHPGARLGPHETDQQKLEMAEKLREFYGEHRKILVDNVDGDMHKAYGELPNMVYVINPDGKVIYRCNWAFPKYIDKVLANRDQLHTKEYMAIITAAPWVMIPVVLRGGWDALWDLLIALPMITIAHLKADWQNLKKKMSGGPEKKEAAK